jgi:hypothetical protein
MTSRLVISELIVILAILAEFSLSYTSVGASVNNTEKTC